MSHKSTMQSISQFRLTCQLMNKSHGVRKFLMVETIVRKVFMKYYAEQIINVIHKCATVSFSYLKISFEYFSPNRSRAGNSTQQSCQAVLSRRLNNLLTFVNQRLYLLLLLKRQGLPTSALDVIFQAFILSWFRYALPAFAGFLSAADVARINAFFS